MCKLYNEVVLVFGFFTFMLQMKKEIIKKEKEKGNKSLRSYTNPMVGDGTT